jgi:hypothetical protein
MRISSELSTKIVGVGERKTVDDNKFLFFSGKKRAEYVNYK